jgi:hypothetical protein
VRPDDPPPVPVPKYYNDLGYTKEDMIKLQKDPYLRKQYYERLSIPVPEKVLSEIRKLENQKPPPPIEKPPPVKPPPVKPPPEKPPPVKPPPVKPPPVKPYPQAIFYDPKKPPPKAPPPIGSRIPYPAFLKISFRETYKQLFERCGKDFADWEFHVHYPEALPNNGR